MTVRILHGDCRDVLATLPDASVHCAVTSPPYFNLRDYQVDGQIGLEPTPEEYITQLVAVFREVKRVLRDDGTLWLNIGSSFASKAIKSTFYIIKRSLPEESRREVAQAMSSVWAGHESPEQALPDLLCDIGGASGKSRRSDVQTVFPAISDTRQPNGQGTGALLLATVREIGQPDAEAHHPASPMCCVQQGHQTHAIGRAEEPDGANVLLSEMLVSTQSERTPLSLERRPDRETEPGWGGVAECGDDAGQGLLSNLPCEQPSGGPSYPAIPQPPGSSVRSEQWDHLVPNLSQKDRTAGIGSGGGIAGNRDGAAHGLASIVFPKSVIPVGFDQWCEPETIIKPKDDMGIPHRLAFALRADGWYLRSDILWSKPNAMPESVSDRPTKSHEYVFLLTKRPRYFYDAEAIKEPASEALIRQINDGYAGQDTKDFASSGAQSASGTKARIIAQARDKIDKQRGHSRRHAGFNDRWDALTRDEQMSIGSNARTVWTIATAPFPGSHFATMPPELAERCIRAGTSEKGACSACSSPWGRIVERTVAMTSGSGRAGNKPNGKHAGSEQAESGTYDIRMGPSVSSITAGWAPSCACDAPAVPCVVLDPFGGAGTTGLVADRLCRDAVLIELNPAYANMARDRIHDDAPLLGSVA